MELSAALNEPTYKNKIYELLKCQQKLNDSLNSYKDISKFLTTLPQKSTHECLIPINQYGFFKGNIVDTNKILVFLGDGYFVERTAYETQQIISRREQVLNQNIAQLQNQIDSFKNNQIFYPKESFQTKWNNDGTLEIQEAFNSNQQNVPPETNPQSFKTMSPQEEDQWFQQKELRMQELMLQEQQELNHNNEQFQSSPKPASAQNTGNVFDIMSNVIQESHKEQTSTMTGFIPKIKEHDPHEVHKPTPPKKLSIFQQELRNKKK